MRDQSNQTKYVLTVLIASHDAATRKKLLNVLDSDPFHSVIVETCKDALEILMDTDFDLVIFDPDLPALSGSDALELIKKLRPRTPLIQKRMATSRSPRGDISIWRN